MLVSDWMTPAPLTVSADAPVQEALRLLRAKGFRRLPVVNGAKLVGIVTDKDLKNASHSPTDIPVVRQVMAHPVLTVGAAEFLEEAALKMQQHKVAGLPVLDAAGALVGILTISDVLRAFTTVLGLHEGGVRIVLTMPDVPGSLARAVEVFQPSNIVSAATAGVQNGMRSFVIRATGEGINSLPERLRAAGINFTS